MPERTETVREQIQKIIEEMCDDFCHWPDVVRSGEELQEHCDKCPLNRL